LENCMLFILDITSASHNSQAEKKRKTTRAGRKTLPASIKEKETHWLEVPWQCLFLRSTTKRLRSLGSQFVEKKIKLVIVLACKEFDTSWAPVGEKRHAYFLVLKKSRGD